jgi:hypothetical protein
MSLRAAFRHFPPARSLRGRPKTQKRSLPSASGSRRSAPAPFLISSLRRAPLSAPRWLTEAGPIFHRGAVALQAIRNSKPQKRDAARFRSDEKGGQLYGAGGNVKDATGRGFRSSLDVSASAKALPLGFHRAHLLLRVQKKELTTK